MRQRSFTVIGTATVFVAAVVLLQLVLQRTAVGQTPAPGSKAAGITTPWGEPDLQGVWTNDFQVPFERPVRFANKEFFTEAEVAGLDKERMGSARLGDRRFVKRGSVQDVAGAYNTVFTTTKRSGRRTSLVVDPPNGKIPPLTPEGQERAAERRAFEVALLQATIICKDKLPNCAGGTYGPPSPKFEEQSPHYGSLRFRNRADGPEDRGLSERCMGYGLPGFGGGVLPFYPRIVQSRGTVSIYYDAGQGQGWQRVIPITDRPHLASSVRQWWGDSRGRWEGNTLVVDVTNFGPKREYRGSSVNLHLVERFTRVDAMTVEYSVTVEDPTTWTRSWTAKQEWTKQDDSLNRHYIEPRCHEGNYGLAGQLVNTRAMEKAFAEGQGPDPRTLCIGDCGNGINDENRDPLR